jgi:hypothetical protein
MRRHFPYKGISISCALSHTPRNFVCRETEHLGVARVGAHTGTNLIKYSSERTAENNYKLRMCELALSHNTQSLSLAQNNREARTATRGEMINLNFPNEWCRSEVWADGRRKRAEEKNLGGSKLLTRLFAERLKSLRSQIPGTCNQIIAPVLAPPPAIFDGTKILMHKRRRKAAACARRRQKYKSN